MLGSCHKWVLLHCSMQCMPRRYIQSILQQKSAVSIAHRYHAVCRKLDTDLCDDLEFRRRSLSDTSRVLISTLPLLLLQGSRSTMNGAAR